MKKYLLKTIYVFLSLLSIIIVVMIFIIYTPYGLKITSSLLSKLTNQKLVMKNISGSLSKSVKIQEIKYQTSAITVKLYQVHLIINLHDFLFIRALSGQLHWKHSQVHSKNIHAVMGNGLINFYFNDVNGSVKSHNLHGCLENKPFNATLSADFSRTKFDIHNLLIHSGKSTIHAAGNLEKQWDLLWSLQINNLGDFLNNSSGTLTSIGKITGSKNNPVVVTTVLGSDINFQKLSVKNFRLSVNGTLLDNVIRFDASSPLLNVKTELTGSITNKQWKGNINFFNLENYDLGKWSMIHKARLKIGFDDQALSNICLQNASQQFCLGLAHNSKQTKITGRLSKIELQPFLKIMSQKPVQLTNTINGEFYLEKSIATKGQFNIEASNGKIPSLGLAIKNISFTGNLHKSGLLQFLGQITSKGTLHIKGHADLFSPNIPLNISLNGQNILVMNTSAYTIFASPNLSVQKKAADKYFINGSILIPKAKINSPEFTQNNQIISNDIHFVNNASNQNSTIYNGKIDLSLGKSVQINIKGLSGQLIGSLHANLNAPNLTTAIGSLELMKGKYDAYGEKLQVKTGKIIYSGGLITNPGIELIAAKTIRAIGTNATKSFEQNFSLPTSNITDQQVIVGVKASGTLQHYNVTLFSDPAIYSQADILSLILTGQTTENLSKNKAQLLLKAVSAFQSHENTIGNITEKLQKSLGLDDLEIKSQNYIVDGETTEGTSLTAGKHLTSHLSVSYSIGLLKPISILLVKYILNKNWLIQSNTSTQDTGVDIFYSIK